MTVSLGMPSQEKDQDRHPQGWASLDAQMPLAGLF